MKFRGKILLSSLKSPDRPWCPLSFLFNGYGISFRKLKQLLLESSFQIKNEWNYAPTPPICLHGADRVNL